MKTKKKIKTNQFKIKKLGMFWYLIRKYELFIPLGGGYLKKL